MEKIFLEKIKEQLLAEKSVLEIKNVSEIDLDGDDTDRIQAKILMQVDAQLNIRSANKLKQIEHALIKIENNTYGICIDCEEEIENKRLINNPQFQTCVICAEKREFESKQRANK
jgi:DnaK suppressor protein